MAAPDPNLITIGLGLASGAGGALITVLTAKIKAGPDSERAGTERFDKLVARMEGEIARAVKDRDRLEALLGAAEERSDRAERVASRLEVLVLRLEAWIDEAVIHFQQRGITDFPPPPAKSNGRHRDPS